MKNTDSKYNPLEHIFNVFPNKKPTLLTLKQMELVYGFLKLGGIVCETEQEIVEALGLLALPGVLSIVVNKNNTVLIGNNYNGK